MNKDIVFLICFFLFTSLIVVISLLSGADIAEKSLAHKCLTESEFKIQNEKYECHLVKE